MLAGGDWIIPQANGLPYIEKPPLLYYLVAGSMALFGESELAIRLVPSVSALGCFFAVIWFGHRLRRVDAGILAGLILLSSMGFIILSRIVLFDVMLTAFLNAALFASYVAWRSHDRRLIRTAYLLLALAILSKGFVAIVLFGLVWVVFLATGDRRGWLPAFRFLLDPWGLALFFLVAAPWHIAAIWVHSGFAWYYFVNEHLLRFLGQRQPHDFYTGTVLYYLPRILLFLFPWTLLLPLLFRSRSDTTTGNGDLRRFLWSLFLTTLLFFSLSLAKANYYIVVAMPALALLLALAIKDETDNGKNRRIAILMSLAIPVALSLAAIRAWWLPRGHGYLSIPLDFQAVSITIGAFIILGSTAAILAWNGRFRTAIFFFALLFAPLKFYFLTVVHENEAYISARPLAHYLASYGGEVFLYKDYERISALQFYLKRPVSIIDSASNDLWYGQKQDGGKGRFVSLDNFLLSICRGKRVVVVHDKRLDDFRNKVPASLMQPVAHFGRVHVLAVCHGTGNCPGTATPGTEEKTCPSPE